MSLYSKWEEMAYHIDNQEEYNEFWGEYLPKETVFYEYILKNHQEVIEKTLVELAKLFDVDVLTAIGFVDGINTSLKTEIDVNALTEDSLVKLDIDFQKLYFNMLDAKADWLFGLPGWDDIISPDKRKEITKEYNRSKIFINENKVGRNDDCPCGSGRKYKKCCGKEQ